MHPWVFDDRSTHTRIIGGSSDTDVNAFTVSPHTPSGHVARPHHRHPGRVAGQDLSKTDRIDAHDMRVYGAKSVQQSPTNRTPADGTPWQGDPPWPPRPTDRTRSRRVTFAEMPVAFGVRGFIGTLPLPESESITIRCP